MPRSINFWKMPPEVAENINKALPLHDRNRLSRALAQKNNADDDDYLSEFALPEFLESYRDDFVYPDGAIRASNKYLALLEELRALLQTPISSATPEDLYAKLLNHLCRKQQNIKGIKIDTLKVNLPNGRREWLHRYNIERALNDATEVAIPEIVAAWLTGFHQNKLIEGEIKDAVSVTYHYKRTPKVNVQKIGPRYQVTFSYHDDIRPVTTLRNFGLGWNLLPFFHRVYSYAEDYNLLDTMVTFANGAISEIEFCVLGNYNSSRLRCILQVTGAAGPAGEGFHEHSGLDFVCERLIAALTKSTFNVQVVAPISWAANHYDRRLWQNVWADPNTPAAAFLLGLSILVYNGLFRVRSAERRALQILNNMGALRYSDRRLRVGFLDLCA